MLQKPDEPIAAQYAGQLLHGEGSHFLNSLKEISPRPPELAPPFQPGIGKPDQTTNSAREQSQSEDAEPWQPLPSTAVDRGSDLQ